MTRLAQTADLTDIQQRDPVDGQELRRQGDHPARAGARARRHLPAGDRRRAQGAGDLRAHHPRGVRRSRGVAADLRAGGRGDRPRLDERLRRHQHALHRRLHDHPARHGRSRRSASCRGWPPARCAARSRCPSRGWAPTSPASAPRPTKHGDGDYVIDGQKMWLTNGGSSTLVAALVRTDEGADEGPPEPDDVPGREAHRLRRGPARADHPRQDRQDGLQGRRHHRAHLRRLPGHGRRHPRRCDPAAGFSQMMDGVEVGRVNVAARACGISIRAFELAIAYAQQRETFGKPIAQHQAIAFQLAEMATKVEAAHAMMVQRRPAEGLRRAQRRRGRHGQAAAPASTAPR